jgi:hypothetical protein
MEEPRCFKCGATQEDLDIEGNKITCLKCGHVEITLTVQDGVSGQKSEIKGEEPHGKVQ